MALIKLGFAILLILISVGAQEESLSSRGNQKKGPRELIKDMYFDVKLPFVDYVRRKGYPVEQHQITTADGYKLTFFRIQAKNQKEMQSKPVVYLQHGLMDSSDTWIVNDEDKAPGFILANRGFDVWCGNVRGNKHSQKHAKLKNTDPEFWDFTWQHMAEYDLPAAFSYISILTNRKVNYIGHSMGTLIMFAALSSGSNSVTKNIDKFIALGPVVFLRHMNSPFLRMAARTNLGDVLLRFGIRELFTPNFKLVNSKLICSIMPLLCSNTVYFFAETSRKNRNSRRDPVFAAHIPGGTSTKNLMHFQQMVNTKDYQLHKFNYGKERNLEIYRQHEPPVYNIRGIQQKVYLLVGKTDPLSHPLDVKLLSGVLPNSFYREYDIGHVSFVWGNDLSYFDDVLKILNGQEI